MSKGKQRYRTANNIRDAIDKFKAKAQKLRDSAASLDMVADQFVKVGGHNNMVAFNRTQADKKRISAGRIEQNTLEHLKQKLAEFQTELLPGIISDGDRSIPRSTRKQKLKLV